MKGGRLSSQQREALTWLRDYVSSLSQEALRLALTKVPVELKLPDERVAEKLLTGLLAVYIHQVGKWNISEERQRHLWASAQAQVEERAKEKLELESITEGSHP